MPHCAFCYRRAASFQAVSGLMVPYSYVSHHVARIMSCRVVPTSIFLVSCRKILYRIQFFLYSMLSCEIVSYRYFCYCFVSYCNFLVSSYHIYITSVTSSCVVSSYVVSSCVVSSCVTSSCVVWFCVMPCLLCTLHFNTPCFVTFYFAVWPFNA